MIAKEKEVRTCVLASLILGNGDINFEKTNHTNFSSFVFPAFSHWNFIFSGETK